MAKKSATHEESTETTRMSFGDHLEELRRRVIFALIGVVLATVLCFKFGGHIIETLAAPYTAAMKELGHDAQLVQLNPTEAFIEYFKISLKFGLLFSAPWVLYQIWQFVAAGLYPAERRIVRYFAPTSILLFVTGASFMVTIVLVGLMKFLISMAGWFPMPDPEHNWLSRFLESPVGPAVVTTAPAEPPLDIPLWSGDPAQWPPDEDRAHVWIDPGTERLNVHFDGRQFSVRLEETGARRFVRPLFDVKEYLAFVVNLALAFGLGFQIPIVVVFLIAMNIVSAAWLGSVRKYVILGVLVLAAIITPSPDVGTMMLLAVPMILLFEIGLAVGRVIEKRRPTS